VNSCEGETALCADAGGAGDTRLAGAAARAFVVMPRSHWAYELDFGSDAWMPESLRRFDIDPAQLSERTNAAAIEFSPEESDRAAHFLRDLLTHLAGSDFSLAFPSHPVIATLHHHKQIW